MKNINEIKKKIYKMCYFTAEVRKADKILDIYQTGKMNKENYYNHIRRLTKNITSDRSITEWERISEIVEFELFGGREYGQL